MKANTLKNLVIILVLTPFCLSLAQTSPRTMDEAISSSLDLFTKARQNEENYHIAAAAGLYMKALMPLEKYLGQPLTATYHGSQIDLYDEIYISLQSILTRVNLQPSHFKFQAKIGQPLSSPIEIKATFASLEEVSPPITDLPLTFSFIKGDGELTGQATTNNQGLAYGRVLEVKSAEDIQLIRIRMDFDQLIDLDKAAPTIKGIIENLTRPTALVVLDVASLFVYLSSAESNLGGRLSSPVIEPVLKNELSQFGFNLTGNKSGATYVISIKAQTTKGSSVPGGSYSSFASLSVQVSDQIKKQTIYDRTISDIKGIDKSYESAGRKALAGAADQMRDEIAPELIKALQE